MPAHPDDPSHIAECAECRLSVSRHGEDVDLDSVWLGITGHVWTRQVGSIERLAVWLLRSPGLARALVTTPSLVLSWILASAAVLIVGMVATQGTGTPLVALLAPALAGAGVAYAYGPGVDPAYELTQTMAVSERMILLVRVVAVFGVNALLGLLASLISAQAVGLTLGWLVPMTTISTLGLAAATLARSANVGVGAALAGWAIIVLASAAHTDHLAAAVSSEGLMPVYVVGTTAFIGVALWASGGRRERVIAWR